MEAAALAAVAAPGLAAGSRGITIDSEPHFATRVGYIIRILIVSAARNEIYLTRTSGSQTLLATQHSLQLHTVVYRDTTNTVFRRKLHQLCNS